MEHRREIIMQIIAEAALLIAVHLALYMEGQVKINFPAFWRWGA